MNNKWIILLVIVMLFSLFTGCSSEKPVENTGNQSEATEPENTTEPTAQDESKKDSNPSVSLSGTGCGEVYESGDISYSVIGLRTNEYNDGVKYLILKMEAYNRSSDDINFSTMDRLTLFGDSGAEYMLDMFADVETSLSGQITPDNKIMGEVAFDISDSKDENYILHIGESFEYTPAITIKNSDIDKTFTEQFESSGVVSDYTIGVPVESKQLSILLKSASIKPSDKEGKEVLLLDVDVTNNESESNNFMLGINFNGVFTTDGIQLNDEVNEWTLRGDMQSSETVSGIASFYIEEGVRDFYMTVTPNLDEFSNKVNIVFTAE